MTDDNIVASILRAVDAEGVPAGARPVNIESSTDGLPDGAMTYIEFDTGHMVGTMHPTVLTEGEQWALAALLALRRSLAGLAERCVR